jgi:rubrerythrin
MTWLKEALQWAIELELATLPPYLCARWSIPQPDDTDATKRFRRVVKEEMLHMGAVANMLVAIGGNPVMIGEAVQTYPGKLPGGVHPTLTVTLGALTDSQLDLFMTIEEPETPIPSAMREEETFPTIGRFYAAVAAAFECNNPAISMTGQLARAPQFADLDAVLKGLDHIAQEGEGLSETPYYGGKLTHHYVFGELRKRRTFIETSTGWDYVGQEVRFPRVAALTGPAPADNAANIVFNDTYSKMLRSLHDVWNGEPGAWSDALGAMLVVESLARRVMAQQYWPTFEYRSPQ